LGLCAGMYSNDYEDYCVAYYFNYEPEYTHFGGNVYVNNRYWVDRLAPYIGGSNAGQYVMGGDTAANRASNKEFNCPSISIYDTNFTYGWNEKAGYENPSYYMPSKLQTLRYPDLNSYASCAGGLRVNHYLPSVPMPEVRNEGDSNSNPTVFPHSASANVLAVPGNVNSFQFIHAKGDKSTWNQRFYYFYIDGLR
ncbi:MAG: hypothetical protein IKS20_13130, partial [Victivallales bacterium]|nr:hypothetical protein [Victivallales bacterium]